MIAETEALSRQQTIASMRSRRSAIVGEAADNDKLSHHDETEIYVSSEYEQENNIGTGGSDGDAAKDTELPKKRLENGDGGGYFAEGGLQQILSIASSAPTASDFPDGGLHAWVVVFGCFVLSFSSFGILNSFGAFQTYYGTHMLSHKTASEIAWIGSVQLGLMQMAGVMAGRIFDWYGPRFLLLFGGIFVITSDFILSVSTQYYQFFLAQGILFGIGNAMLFYPAMGCIQHWWYKRRGIAVSIYVGGSSIGGAVWPIIFNKLTHKIGFPWTMRTIGFIKIPLFVIVNLLVRGRLGRRNTGPFFDFSYFRDKRFTFLAIGFFFIMLANFTPYFFVGNLALKEGISPNLAPYMLSIMNGMSFFGRVLPGFLADHIGPFNMICPSILACSILIYACIGVNNAGGLIVFAALYGFFSGSNITLQNTCIGRICPDIRKIGSMMGMGGIFVSLSLFLGTPVSGAILNASGGDFRNTLLFAGSSMAFGAVCLIISRFYCLPVKLI